MSSCRCFRLTSRSTPTPTVKTWRGSRSWRGSASEWRKCGSRTPAPDRRNTCPLRNSSRVSQVERWRDTGVEEARWCCDRLGVDVVGCLSYLRREGRRKGEGNTSRRGINVKREREREEWRGRRAEPPTSQIFPFSFLIQHVSAWRNYWWMARDWPNIVTWLNFSAIERHVAADSILTR